MRSSPNAMPPCGGAPYWSASSRKPNFAPRLLLADPERTEHLRLHFAAVDPDRTAADLPAVEHDVVRLGDRRARVGLDEALVAVLRTGERMVHRGPALRLLVVLEHREVDHPQRLPAACGEPVLVADLRPQRAERVVRDLRRSAPKNTRSPVCAPVRSRIAASTSAARNFTIGDCSPLRSASRRRSP